MYFRIHVFQGPSIIGSRFFQGPGFSGSRFFRVQVFLSLGFPGSRFFGVRVQGPGPGFRSSPQMEIEKQKLFNSELRQSRDSHSLKQPPKMFYKKVFLKNFQKITKNKSTSKSLFNKVATEAFNLVK